MTTDLKNKTKQQQQQQQQNNIFVDMLLRL